MAGVFWGGGKADEVAGYDEYDPTPCNGGYDCYSTNNMITWTTNNMLG
jgi:hypothetical protein